MRQPIFVILIIATSLLAAQTKPAPKPGAPSNATSANKEFLAAVENLRQGRLAAAEPVLTKLLKAAPDNPDLLMALGSLYSMKGETNKAVAMLEKSVKAKPTSQGYTGLAAAYNDAGRPDDTVNALRKAISLDATNLPANFNLASIYMQVNAFKDAAPLLERVVKAKPTEPEPAYLLALCYSASGDPAKAKALLLKLPAAARDSEQVLLLLASSVASLGDKAEARKYYQRVIERNPISVPGLANLGAMMVREGEREKGIELLDKAYKQDRSSYLAGFSLALAYREAGKLAEARSVLATLLTKGETPEIYVLFGMVEDGLGNHEAATGHFQRAIDLDPSEGNQFALGYSHLRAGKADLAETYFRAALEKAPLSSQMRLGLGASYLAGNKNKEALDALQPLASDPQAAKLIALASGARDEAKVKAAIVELGPK